MLPRRWWLMPTTTPRCASPPADPTLAGGGDHLVGLLEVERHRLLTVHVDAAPRGGDGDRGMRIWGQVQTWTTSGRTEFEQVLVLGEVVVGRHAVLVAERAHPLGVDVAQRDEARRAARRGGAGGRCGRCRRSPRGTACPYQTSAPPAWCEKPLARIDGCCFDHEHSGYYAGGFDLTLWPPLR